MPDNFYQSWAAKKLAPQFLQGYWGQKWSGAIGLASDSLTAAAQQAVGARFIATCPADALPDHGQDRQIVRYPADTNASYRARLASAWPTWKAGGTYNGVFGQLVAFGFAPTSIGIFDVSGDASQQSATNLGPGGQTPWPPDSNTSNWSRFWISLTPPFPSFLQWQARFWGDGGTWGQLGPDGTAYTWGSTATVRQVQTIKRLVKQWKPVQCVCAGIWLMFGTGTVMWSGT